MSGTEGLPPSVWAIIQVPNPAGSIPGGFSFVRIEVTSEELPASAFTVDAVRNLGAALGASLAERPDPEHYRGWLNYYSAGER